MPRYYFDVFDGCAVVRDDYGDVFGSVREAADQAAGLLADVAHECLRDRRNRDFAVAVRSGGEGDVYRAALIFRESFPDRGSPATVRDADGVLSIPDPADLIRRSQDTRATSERLAWRIRDAAAGLRDAAQQAVEDLTLARAALAGIA